MEDPTAGAISRPDLAGRGLAIVETGGPAEAEGRDLEGLGRAWVSAGRAELAAHRRVVQRRAIYVGPDTSSTHLAAATGCPTVAMFGPATRGSGGPGRWGMATPWQASGTIQHRGNVWIVQNPLPCLPCTLEGCERQLGSDSVCLRELAAEQVLAAADEALGKAG